MTDEIFNYVDVTLDGSSLLELDCFESTYHGIYGFQQFDDGFQTINETLTKETDIATIKKETTQDQAADPNIDSQMPHSSSSYRSQSSLPASDNWPGEYGFTAYVEYHEKSNKGVTWTYSKLKDKLYVGKDAFCPINFCANTIPPNDAVIRALVVYSSPAHMEEEVRRCANHSTDELSKGIAEAMHLIRCGSRLASYEISPDTNRHSVVVPFESPAVGQQHFTYLYKFTCFGSCAGGPNKRPLMIVFTLEKDNQVLGRHKLDVKICACPGRDRKFEEYQLSKAAEPVKRNEPFEAEWARRIASPPPKKSKASPNMEGPYVFTVEDPECYEFLVQMKKFFEARKLIKSLPPEAIKNLLRHEQNKEEDN